MPWSWSNPDEDKNNSANMPMPTLHAGDIGSIVRAIMSSRGEATDRDRQDWSSMLSGISKGVSGVAGAYQDNQSANALTGYMQNANQPGATASGSGFDAAQNDYLQQMSPDMRIKAVEWQQGQAERDLKRQMEEIKLQQLQQQLESPGGPNMYSIGGHDLIQGSRGGWKELSGGTDGAAPNGKVWSDVSGGYVTPHQAYSEQQGHMKELDKEVKGLGGLTGSVNDQSAIHGPSDTPANYTGKDSAGKWHPTTVPEDNLLVIGKDGSYNYVTPDYLKQARGTVNARDQYRQVLSQRGLQQARPGGPVTRSDIVPAGGPGSGRVTQGDVNQAKEAPTETDIKFLREHPDKADKFDMHFGAGSAAAILSQ